MTVLHLCGSITRNIKPIVRKVVRRKPRGSRKTP
jgi:hypothetical protein